MCTMPFASNFYVNQRIDTEMIIDSKQLLWASYMIDNSFVTADEWKYHTLYWQDTLLLSMDCITPNRSYLIFSHSGLRTAISSQIAHILQSMHLANHVPVFISCAILMLVPVVNMHNNVYAVSVGLPVHRLNVEHSSGKNIACQWTIYNYVISGFYQSVNKVFTLLGYCAALIVCLL